MLAAHIETQTKLTQSGQLHTIICPELNITVTSKTPERKLCREIVLKAPDRATEQLKIYRDEKPSSIIKNIKRFSKSTIIDSPERGLYEGVYREPPAKTN